MIRAGTIRLRRGEILDYLATPKPSRFDFGRVEGMLLGLAIGDALGNPTESLLPVDRRELYGEIRDYARHPHGSDNRGYPSDDTQLAFWALEQSLEDGQLDPERLADRFCQRRIFGIGQTVREFIRNRRAGLPLAECGPDSAGNGALMRIAPVLVPHLRTGGTAVWADAALAAMLTHNNDASAAACIAFTVMLWDLLDTDRPPPPEWWIERFASVAETLEIGVEYAPRGGRFVGYRGPLSRFVREAVGWAIAKDLSTFEACDAFWSGAYLLETVPCVLYILARHANSFEEAVVRAVNDTKDNDTIAAIVGAAAGALHSRDRIPARWVEGLSGRTAETDDGRIFELIALARQEHLQRDATLRDTD